jgi:CheY-like chemotaxis protein
LLHSKLYLDFPPGPDYFARMATSPTALVHGKIMVLDDNPIIQRTVLLVLRDHGYKMLTFGAVFDAIHVIRNERPDLVLVDLSFPLDPTNIGGPQADGYFFIAWVRRTPEVKDTPIVIISGTEPAKYQNQIADLKITACLHKPLKKEELLATVQTILGGNVADQRD